MLIFGGLVIARINAYLPC